MKTIFRAILATSLILLGCGGEGATSSANGAPEKPGACGNIQSAYIAPDDFPKDCAGLDTEKTYQCAEKRFWLVMRDEYNERGPFYDVLTGLITELEKDGEPHRIADLYFRKGQLGMVLAIEHQDQAKVFEVNPAFDKALELYPEHPLVPTWRDTMNIAAAIITQDNVKLKELFDIALANVDSCPLGNIPSLTGTTIGAAMSTGIPQQTIELAKTWKCEGVEWCTDNTWKGPYVVPGMRYHMGEGFARVGDKTNALMYFQSAAEAPGFDTWPFRDFVQDKIDNIDPFLKSFADLGPDGSAFTMSYANSSFGCRFCHGVNAATP